MRKTFSNRGMTLVELMSTVVVIGIVAAMSVPRFQIAYERMEMRSANRDIHSTLKLARSLAITDKQMYGVHFNSDACAVTLYKDLVNIATPDFVTGDSIIRIDTLPKEFNLLSTDCTNDCIIFRPNGSANFTGGGNIWSYGETEGVVGIGLHNVLASTGRVQLEDYYY